MRHADALPTAAGGDDHDRPLSVRGREQAQRVGVFLAGLPLRPARVLCSSALRARQTIEAIATELPWNPPVDVERALYLAEEDRLLERIAELPDDERAVLLVIHNPGCAGLARALAGLGRPEDLERLRRFPPASLAVLHFETRRWQLAPGSGRLGCLRFGSDGT